MVAEEIKKWVMEWVAGWTKSRFFLRSSHQQTSRGAASAAQPIILDSGGKIDASFIDDADIDHGSIGGLADDDHAQYALLAGRASSQVLNGGTAANEDVTIRGTSHATKTTSYVLLQDTGGLVGIGTTAPAQLLTLNAALPIIEFDIATVAKAYIGVSSGTNAIVTGSAAGDTVIRTANQKILVSVNDGTTAHLTISAAGAVNIPGAVDLDTTLNVDGATTLQTTLNAKGAVDFDSTLNVDGMATLQNKAQINQTATTGNALNVTRNLTSTSTDSPVVSIVQDHASDDQAALRVQQDATWYAVDIAAALPFTFTNIGTGTYNRSVIYHDSTNGFYFDMARLTDAVGGTPVPWAIGPRGGTTPWFKADTNGSVGINVTTPTGKLHVEQSSTTAAIPTLRLKQSDLSEEFIRFETTVSAGNPVNTTALGAYYGRVRVYVEGVGAKWLALYD